MERVDKLTAEEVLDALLTKAEAMGSSPDGEDIIRALERAGYRITETAENSDADRFRNPSLLSLLRDCLRSSPSAGRHR